MKNIVLAAVSAMALTVFSVEKLSVEWSQLVTRCALERDSIEAEIGKLRPDQQPSFAFDVVKAVSVFPAGSDKVSRVRYAALLTVLGASDEKLTAVKAAAVEAVPADMKKDILKIVSSVRQGPLPKIIVEMQTSGGIEIKDALLADLHSPTNMSVGEGYFLAPGTPGAMIPQSDIGVLRVPRPIEKRRKADKPDMAEPGPYWLQSL